jgi:hypothetical protein
MTVSTQQRRVQYALDGISTAFAVPFPFPAASDLLVTRTSALGVDTLLVLNAGYTVTGAGNPAGGTVTLTDPGALGERLTVKRTIARTQETDYVPNDPFPAVAHEAALDKLTMIAQEDGDELARALVVPDTDPRRGQMILPAMPGRAGKVLGFDAAGKPTPVEIGAADGSLRTDLAGPSGPALIGFTGETSLQAMLNRLNELTFDARIWGVTGDGTNRTAEMHAVTNACEAAGGGFIQLPRGIIGTTGMARTGVLGVPWRMVGYGSQNTTLRKVGASSAPVFQLTGPAGYEWFGGFQDMAFDGPFGVPVPPQNGLHLRAIARCVTDRIRVARCNQGVELEGALILNFNDCSVNGNVGGYRTRKFGTTPYANLIRWQGGECRGNTGIGFDLGDGEALDIHGVDISGNGTAGTGFTGAIFVRDTVDNEFGYARVMLRNLYIEANHSRAIFVENAAGLYLDMQNVGVLGHLAVPSFPPVEIGGIAMSRIGAGSLLLCDTQIYAQQSLTDGALISNLNDTSALRHHVALRGSGPPVNLSLANGTIRATPTTLGVFGSAGTAKPTITGSRASGAALQSMLSAMAAMGFWTDGTSA